MNSTAGFIVLAKRPDYRGNTEFTYEAAGGVSPTFDAADNHQAYCQLSAERDPSRYGDVEYVVARLTLEGSPS